MASDASPVTLSSVTLSHLSRGLFSSRTVGTLQEAVEIAARELSPQNQAKLILDIYDLLGDITEAANA